MRRKDSGTKEFSITYAAHPGENVTLCGGTRIHGWKKADGKLWSAPVAAGDGFRPTAFFVNDQPRQRARFPKTGALKGLQSKDGLTLIFPAGQLKSWNNPGDVELDVDSFWTRSRQHLPNVDALHNSITFNKCPLIFYDNAELGPAVKSMLPTLPYHFENALEFLDSPGEWYVDRKTGVLYYWPLDGEDPEHIHAVLARINALVELQGQAARPVMNLRFRGLTFSHANWPLPVDGLMPSQAGFENAQKHPSAAVQMQFAQNCRIEDCRILNCGGAGVSLSCGCDGNILSGNEIANIGATGVEVGDLTLASPPRDNVISNNFIHHCAQKESGSIGIWVGITEHTVVSHNEMWALPYTGISLGWEWSTRKTAAKDNVLEFNDIHDVMQEMADGAGIYTLGAQPGSILRGNLIHDIKRSPDAIGSPANGLYLDEGSSGFRVEGNTVYGIPLHIIKEWQQSNTTLQFHKATGNAVRKNVFVVDAGQPPITYVECDKKDEVVEDNATPAASEWTPPKNPNAGVEPAYAARMKIHRD